jgi:hypothetical protein
MSSDNFLNVPLNLQTVLKSSYLTKEQASSLLTKNGYSFDSEISNNNTRVFYNPNENKTLLTLRGTNNLFDVVTDLSLFVGGTDGIKTTSRYKQTELIYKKAKQYILLKKIEKFISYLIYFSSYIAIIIIISRKKNTIINRIESS